MFPAHEKLLAHLNEQHFTDEALDQLASFRKGSFNEWLKVTGRDGGTQSTSGTLANFLWSGYNRLNVCR